MTRKRGRPIMTTAVRRAQSVVWVSHEMEQGADIDVRQAVESEMRRKVKAMAGGTAEEVRLVSLTRLDPHDPEFDMLIRQQGHDVPDASPWMGVWEVVGGGAGQSDTPESA